TRLWRQPWDRVFEIPRPDRSRIVVRLCRAASTAPHPGRAPGHETRTGPGDTSQRSALVPWPAGVDRETRGQISAWPGFRFGAPRGGGGLALQNAAPFLFRGNHGL